MSVDDPLEREIDDLHEEMVSSGLALFRDGVRPSRPGRAAISLLLERLELRHSAPLRRTLMYVGYAALHAFEPGSESLRLPLVDGRRISALGPDPSEDDCAEVLAQIMMTPVDFVDGMGVEYSLDTYFGVVSPTRFLTRLDRHPRIRGLDGIAELHDVNCEPDIDWSRRFQRQADDACRHLGDAAHAAFDPEDPFETSEWECEVSRLTRRRFQRSAGELSRGIILGVAEMALNLAPAMVEPDDDY